MEMTGEGKSVVAGSEARSKKGAMEGNGKWLLSE